MFVCFPGSVVGMVEVESALPVTKEDALVGRVTEDEEACCWRSSPSEGLALATMEFASPKSLLPAPPAKGLVRRLAVAERTCEIYFKKLNRVWNKILISRFHTIAYLTGSG